MVNRCKVGAQAWIEQAIKMDGESLPRFSKAGEGREERFPAVSGSRQQSRAYGINPGRFRVHMET